MMNVFSASVAKLSCLGFVAKQIASCHVTFMFVVSQAFLSHRTGF